MTGDGQRDCEEKDEIKVMRPVVKYMNWIRFIKNFVERRRRPYIRSTPVPKKQTNTSNNIGFTDLNTTCISSESCLRTI